MAKRHTKRTTNNSLRYSMHDNGSFSLVADTKEQMHMLAELASICSERISSFGPVTEDDSLTAILIVMSRTDRIALNKKIADRKAAKLKAKNEPPK